MDLKEKLTDIVKRNAHTSLPCITTDFHLNLFVNGLLSAGVTVQEYARPIEEWGEDCGDVLWWKFPIEEPPYVGSPLDEKWPGYHTHWTTIQMPEPPKGD